MRIRTLLLAFIILPWTSTPASAGGETGASAAPNPAGPVNLAPSADTAKAIFAGGCFWCMEPAFEKLPGVYDAVSGYTGGQEANPTYEEVSAGRTGHCEAVEVLYNPKKVTYAKLLDAYWRSIDPTTVNREFTDSGSQYRTAIFYLSEDQKRRAEASKARLEKAHRFSKPIVTEITAAGPFYRAEEYHQDFYKKNPARYHAYRLFSGRDEYLKKIWGASGSAGDAKESSRKKTVNSPGSSQGAPAVSRAPGSSK